MQDLLLFELSENGNPITDDNGNVVTCVADVVEAVYNLSPTLAHTVSLVLSNQCKWIEDLQGEIDSLQAQYDNLDDSYLQLHSQLVWIDEIPVTELLNEIEYQNEINGTLNEEGKQVLMEKATAISDALKASTGTI